MRPAAVHRVRAWPGWSVQGGDQEEYRVTGRSGPAGQPTVCPSTTSPRRSPPPTSSARSAGSRTTTSSTSCVSDTRFADLDQIGANRRALGHERPGARWQTSATVTARRRVPQWIRVTADGHDAVLFKVYPAARRQHGADRQGDDRQSSPSFRPQLPPGVTHRQLVRPERAHRRLRHQRARRHPDRRRCWRPLILLALPAQPARSR